MKRVALMISLSLFPRLLAAQALDMAHLAGEDWYGLYLNGQKSGYALNAVARGDDGAVTVTEDARFRLNMVGVPQDMRLYSKREYGPDGNLTRIESHVVDPKGTSEFEAVIEGDELVLRATIGGADSEQRFPRPKETLQGALKHAELANRGAKVGDALTFAMFEPMKPGEIQGRSEIVAVEERMLEGVSTRVFKIKTKLDFMNIETVSYVTEDGATLEDITAGIVTMRLEPKEIAQDVNYNNDVIVSNAALVERPIEDPRGRASLSLRLVGPLGPAHLFNDERQFLSQKGDGIEFVGKAIAPDGFTPARLPIEDESVQEWLKPTLIVQSDDPRLIEKAREIAGDEKDTRKISNRLCQWVHENVYQTFSARLTNALEVLGSLEGDCTEHSILFIALARAAGLPAREVAGLVYVEGAQPGFYFHQWAKVWIGKWIDVDPTFNQPLADVTHIKLAEGDLFQQVQLIPIIGQIRVEVLDEARGE